MIQLNFPPTELKTRFQDGLLTVFDPVRKKYVFLTPEEQVRQMMIQFLRMENKIPFSHMAVEKMIRYHHLAKRPDIVLFDRQTKPVMVVECKSPGIKLGKNSMEQLATYNKVMGTPFILLTNGLVHLSCKLNLQEETYVMMDHIPDFEELNLFERS